MRREVRIRQVPDGFHNGKLAMRPQPLVRLGEVGKWSMVRHAEFPQAAPFVLSTKEWEKLPIGSDE